MKTQLQLIEISGKLCTATELCPRLLEEIQGISTTESVIVIGATNYVDRVDPALRRAGRLDQIVEIPRPSIDGLAKIFDHYLESYVQHGV